MPLSDVLLSLEFRLAELARQGVQHLTLPASGEATASREETGEQPHNPSATIQIPAREARIGPFARPAPPLAAAAAPPRPAPASAHREFQQPLPEAGSKHPSELDSLESLHFHFRDCQRCGLSAARTKLVFGVGHARPKLLFVGEGPGQEEDLQGLPFVGRAGQLLTAGISALGLTRDDVYIANVVKCRPPDNRVPAPDEIAACAPILQRQIELLDPALIVTLGNVPLKALQPTARGITAERGRLFDYRQWRVLPTFHPAYLLRNPGALEQWWLDLKHAFRLAYRAEF
jgi:DNA polymerase